MNTLNEYRRLKEQVKRHTDRADRATTQEERNVILMYAQKLNRDAERLLSDFKQTDECKEIDSFWNGVAK